jgi:hypothetical protein
LSEVAADTLHEATGTFVVTTGAGHVTSVWVPLLARATGTQTLGMGTLVETIGSGQVVAVQLFQSCASCSVQISTGMLVVTTVLQVVVHHSGSVAPDGSQL